MPSHPDRIRRNYECIFCKGTGWVILTNAADENDKQVFICGSCKGVGTTTARQKTRLISICEVPGY